MRVINARNVNDAYVQGMHLLASEGVPEGSRAGDVIATPFPVTTVYQRPMERVLFNTKRDANPFFHLGEALWMLAGRRDATWLDQFVHDYSERFAEDDGNQHGAYGYRWRQHFELEGGGEPIDQLDTVVKMLRSNPRERRVVIQMWDPLADLGAQKRDVPCNLSVLPRRVNGKLDITVFCRSNDAVWGKYGSNAVHFPILQEYLAARLGVQVGTYTQIANNFHAYANVIQKLGRVEPEQDPYTTQGVNTSLWARPTPIVTHPDSFDDEVRAFVDGGSRDYKNELFSQVAGPMFGAYFAWKKKLYSLAEQSLDLMPERSDWRLAATSWLTKRFK